MYVNEEWRWIKGYEGLYEISNCGRIKSYLKEKDGHILSTVNKTGWYLSVQLTKDGLCKSKRIHVLVAETFIGDIPKGYHVHHKDGNRQNNHVDNLEIIHPSKHVRETIKINPRFLKGMNDYNRFQKPRRIRQFTLDGQFIAEYVNSVVASELTGVCHRNILQVASKTPCGKNGLIRGQAGGYKWEFADEGGEIE